MNEKFYTFKHSCMNQRQQKRQSRLRQAQKHKTSKRNKNKKYHENMRRHSKLRREWVKQQQRKRDAAYVDTVYSDDIDQFFIEYDYYDKLFYEMEAYCEKILFEKWKNRPLSMYYVEFDPFDMSPIYDY